MATSRKDSFTTQFYLIVDALLVLLSFWLAGLLRDPIRLLLYRPAIDQSDLTSIAWVLYIAVPFTPLVLERFGFYEKSRYKKTQVATPDIAAHHQITADDEENIDRDRPGVDAWPPARSADEIVQAGTRRQRIAVTENHQHRRDQAQQ